MVNNNILNTATVPVIVSYGGTGDASLTAYAVLCGGTTTTGVIQSIASVGTSEQVLLSNGAGALPSMQIKNSALAGTTTNDNATAGNMGEFISSSIATASSVALTTNTPVNITSISLTAGDWIVYGQIAFTATSTTHVSQRVGAISTTTGTLPTSISDSTQSSTYFSRASEIIGTNDSCFEISPCRQSLSGTTTIYLVAQATFTTSTLNAYGFIAARRRR